MSELADQIKQENKELEESKKSKEDKQKTQEEEKAKNKPIEINVDSSVAFQLKIQEFDRNIARLESQVADLKRQKAEFAYDQNLQMIADQHRSNLIKQQIEEEAKKRMQGK